SSPPPSAPASTPSWGDVLGNVLVALAKRALTGPASNGTGTGGYHPAAQAEIHPGRWRVQLPTPIHPMAPGPLLVGSMLRLDPSGGFQGQGQLYVMGSMQPCYLAGRWRYDTGGRVLSVQGMVNGAPPIVQRDLRITGGMNGQYSAVDPDGFQCVIQRV